jgi:hypothetical protein
VQLPAPSERYITIVDNKGRAKVQFVEYLVEDVRGEKVYVTSDGLAYVEDSLTRKGQDFALDLLDQIPGVLSNPAIVIKDHLSPDDTRLYYRPVNVALAGQQQLLCVVVKIRQGVCFFYNFFPQQSGKVKGYREIPPPEIWYLAPNHSSRQYGLPSR